MRQVRLIAVFVIAILVAAVWAILPPETKLRRGKDLAGGVSLTYAVQIGANEDSKAVLAQLIDQLKKRVDPDGLFEITMAAQGRDRIEISMPLPSPEVKLLRQEFEDSLVALGRGSLSVPRVDALMRSGAAERAAQLETLSAGNAVRRGMLEDAIKAYDAWQGKLSAYTAETDAAKKDAMLLDVSGAQIAFEQARDRAVKGSLSADEIRRALEASAKPRMIVDGKQTVQLPSPREAAITRIRSAHPEAVAQLDEILAKHAAYEAKRTTLDDPQDLVKLLRGAGVLSFRITVRSGAHPEEARLRTDLRERGPRNSYAADARWYKINQIESWIERKPDAEALAADPNYAVEFFARLGYVVEPYDGEFFMLAYDTRTARLTQADGSWSVVQAYPETDSYGRPAIAFRMNTSGAVLLGKLTGAHVGEPMAILLDDQVYTAPTLRSEISVSGQITGSFPPEEIQYIVRVLGGGSLQAKLYPEPISVIQVGPELGSDNLAKGLRSGLISLIIVAGFMVVYYFGFGLVAVVALLANSLLLLGAMAQSQAAFTMPGIAGLILTFGMAVDSNVLIYERMREEFERGADMKTAIRLGFDRALASIVDGNVTNLIVCFVLYYLGTPEIRGFAVTMGIGVVSTLFAALVVSRLLFDVLAAMGWKQGSMLPMAVPSLQRLLTPSINWIRLRWVFISISIVYVTLGLGLMWSRGPRMLDNEFRGGTQLTVTLRPDGTTGPDGLPGRFTMSREEVDERLKAIASAAPDGDELRLLGGADVIPVNPQADGLTSDRFVIKTLATNSRLVLDAIVERFQDKLETKPSLSFTGAEITDAGRAPVYAIDKPSLGANIDRPSISGDTRAFLGGAAIVVENITPVESLASIRDRLKLTREQAEFSDTLSRTTDLVVIDGTEEQVRSFVLLVRDDSANLFENEGRWDSEVRIREWAIVLEALTTSSTPVSVHNFSATIASTFRANAIAATLVSFLLIGIYIWIRFKTPRYSIAAVVALLHDVVTVVGLLALCEILYEHPRTHDFAAAIGLLPFKIDLNAVAALLTIAGYSLNDTVVVMDRIRENKGKLPHATASIINLSINQTFSRTIITGGTTMGSCIVLYLIGGEGMRAFAFTLLTGLIVGTYSSVAVAAPIVWSRKFDREYAAEGGIVPQPA